MSEPPGQTRTELPANGGTNVILSAVRDVEQGARSMLLLAEGLFRLDVVPHDDTIQTIIRNLSPAPAARARFSAVGGQAQSAAPPGVFPHTTGRFGGDILLVEEDGAERPVARFLVGSVTHIDRGLTSFTAQARLL